MEEFWDLFDENRCPLDRRHKRGNPMPEGCYHLVVSIWVRSEKGMYLMSQRHQNKNYGGLWECTGGCVNAGETSLEGAVREVEEEVRIVLDPMNGKLIRSARREAHHDFYDVYLFEWKGPLPVIRIQEEEVIQAKWMSPSEIRSLWEQKEMHPELFYYQEVFEMAGGR